MTSGIRFYFVITSLRFDSIFASAKQGSHVIGSSFIFLLFSLEAFLKIVWLDVNKIGERVLNAPLEGPHFSLLFSM